MDILYLQNGSGKIEPILITAELQKTEKICKYLLNPGQINFKYPWKKYVPGKHMLLYK